MSVGVHFLQEETDNISINTLSLFLVWHGKTRDATKKWKNKSQDSLINKHIIEPHRVFDIEAVIENIMHILFSNHKNYETHFTIVVWSNLVICFFKTRWAEHWDVLSGMSSRGWGQNKELQKLYIWCRAALNLKVLEFMRHYTEQLYG